MQVLALVMAGGRGERMESSGLTQPKPLVPVLGVPLLERNLWALLRHGIREIVILAPANRPEILRFAEDRCRPLAEACGASLEVWPEQPPRGSIGGAWEFRGRSETYLVVHADNLTSLDLSAFLSDHFESRAAMTLACHHEEWRIPFGELSLGGADGRDLRAYIEKPVHRTLIASAVTALAEGALRFLEPGGFANLPELAARLLEAKEPVRAFFHRSPWVDVNDGEAALRAEDLVSSHFQEFESWAPAVGEERVDLLIEGPEGLLVLDEERNGSRILPGGLLGEGTPSDLAESLLAELFPDIPVSVESLPGFDSFAGRERKTVRHHLLRTTVLSGVEPRIDDLHFTWLPLDRGDRFGLHGPNLAGIRRAMAARGIPL